MRKEIVNLVIAEYSGKVEKPPNVKTLNEYQLKLESQNKKLQNSRS